MKAKSKIIWDSHRRLLYVLHMPAILEFKVTDDAMQQQWYCIVHRCSTIRGCTSHDNQAVTGNEAV